MCADKCTPFPPPTQAQAHKSESASRGEALAQHQGALAQAQGRLAELQHEVEERRVAADRMEGERGELDRSAAARSGLEVWGSVEGRRRPIKQTGQESGMSVNS